MNRARALADELCLASSVKPASDPFFGRTGQIMAVSQLQQALKFEFLVPLHSTEKPTACMSFNYHRDHFGATWGLADQSGGLAHTACVAFGMDRLAVALFFSHGLEPSKWPATVRESLMI
jgi:seryl-tRNA synthetase